MSGPSASHAAGRRAIANTAYRAIGELSGKLGTFALFAVLARELGQSGVGAYVLAFAYVQVMTLLVNLGFDRVVIRRVAMDVSHVPGLVGDVLALKIVMALPVALASWLVADAIGYSATAQAAIRVLSLGLLLDALNTTAAAVLSARERGGLLSISVVANRVLSAVLGIAALLAGYGVVVVCVTYCIGSAVGLVVCLALMSRKVAPPSTRVRPGRWPALLREAVPFALYDGLGFVLGRVDAIALSLLATQAAVGLYGAASRLYEATTFLTFSLNGAFLAMFTYLTRTSDPPVGAVFERSIKLALVLLMPLAVVFGVAAEPISVALFGPAFHETGNSLRLLAPAVALLGVANLSTALVALRVGPARLLWLTGGILVTNIVLNLLLIPPMGAPGAALAMSISVGLLAIGGTALARRETGPLSLVRMLGSPPIAGLGLGLVVAFVHPLVPALAVGGLVFALVYVAVERVIAPDDLRYLLAVLPFGGGRGAA